MLTLKSIETLLNVWMQFKPILLQAFEIVVVLWWVWVPFILWGQFKKHWLFWKNGLWLSRVYKPIVIEVKIPKEILKPIRAMENVMQGVHGVAYQPPNWWEKWIDGQLQTSVSFDIVSIEGEIHFFVRFHKDYRKGIESAIYSQYPEAEISEIEDYVKKVPQDIPNKDWDIAAADYRLIKPNPYPIKTYTKFETEREATEEKIVDPITSLLEGFARMQPGEQFWIQIRAAPLSEPKEKWGGFYDAFLKEGEKIRDTLARRPEKSKLKPILQETAQILMTGKPTEEVKEERDIIPPEMKLTPGEREIITAVEEKIAKSSFQCGIRYVYIGKRNIFFNANFRLAFNFFNSFTTANLNMLQPWGKAFTKIKKSWFLPLNLLRPRRDYMRCRKIFRNYVERVNHFFPRGLPKDKGIFVLNTEELASLYHFPGQAVAPTPSVTRVGAKKGGPPSELPIE